MKKTLCVTIGSGGHTGEMLDILQRLDLSSIEKILFIGFANDKLSVERVKSIKCPNYEFIFIPRAREVNQSFITCIFATTYSLLYTVYVLSKASLPDVVITNGPSIAVPVVFYYWIVSLFKTIRIVFIESVTRVHSLSLSAQILHPFLDTLVIQWEQHPALKSHSKARHICIHSWAQ